MWLAERNQIRRHLEKAVCLVAGDLLLPVGDLHAHDDGRDGRWAFTRENQRVIQRGAEIANPIRGQNNTRWAGCPPGGWIWSGRTCYETAFEVVVYLLVTNWNPFLNLAEKFAITHAEKYFIAGEHLLLPAIEYIYIWNLFAIIEKDKRLVTPILDRVEKKIGQYKNETGRRRANLERSIRKRFEYKPFDSSKSLPNYAMLNAFFSRP